MLHLEADRACGARQVRSLRESRGDVEEAGPSIAVQMVGLNGVPTAGDEFSVCSSEQEVRHCCPKSRNFAAFAVLHCIDALTKLHCAAGQRHD